jgi:hypothetical protein
MQSTTPDTSNTIRHLSDFLKIALPVLALMATALGIAGDKWNKENRRPTRLGYLALITAVLVASVSVASWRADNEVKRLDNAASAAQQTTAVQEQQQRDQAHFDQTIEGLKALNTALTQTNAAQETTLTVALRQLPIDEMELFLKRKEIESALPEDLKAETFAFQKGRGELSTNPDDFQLLFDITSREHLDMLGSLQLGQTAVRSFQSAVDGICKIEITPASIPDGESPSRLRLGSAFYLSSLVLDRDVLTYYFAPDGLSAAYYDGGRARLKIAKQLVVAYGNAKLPPTRSCVSPQEVRLRIRSFGFVSDTGWFKLNWKERYDSFIGFSPVLKFTASTGPDQPPPPK